MICEPMCVTLGQKEADKPPVFAQEELTQNGAGDWGVHQVHG